MKGWLVLSKQGDKIIVCDEFKERWTSKLGDNAVDYEEVRVFGCDRCKRFIPHGDMVSSEEWKRVPEEWRKAMLCNECMTEFIGPFVGF